MISCTIVVQQIQGGEGPLARRLLVIHWSLITTSETTRTPESSREVANTSRSYVEATKDENEMKRHRHGVDGGGHRHSSSSSALDSTLLLFLALLSVIYFAVTTRTFLSLPAVPDDLFRFYGDALDPLDADRNYGAAVRAQREEARGSRASSSDRRGSVVDPIDRPPSDPLKDFPQPIRLDDYEEMEHPGTEGMREGPDAGGITGQKGRRGGRGKEPVNPVILEVPRFWDPPRFAETGGVRSFLGENGGRLMTREEAKTVGSKVRAAGWESKFVEAEDERPARYVRISKVNGVVDAGGGGVG